MRLAAHTLGVPAGRLCSDGEAPIAFAIHTVATIGEAEQPVHADLGYLVRVTEEIADPAWEWVPLTTLPDMVLRERLSARVRTGL